MDVQNMVPGFPSNLTIQKVVIAAGTAKTEMFVTQGQALVGVFIPSAWTAASLGYQAGWNGNINSLLPVYDAGGNPQSTVVVANTYIAIPISQAVFTAYMQITSVDPTDGITPVNQVAAAILYIMLRKFLS